jgi:hypothetical protein
MKNHLKNIVGFRTKRRIVVIESDDWGSIRTRSKHDYEEMLHKGLYLDNNSYTMFDCLESNSDLTSLFDVLSGIKDSNGRHPVFTPMYIMGNPDFAKIEESGFNQYHFEHFLETCKHYPNHDKVGELIKQGIDNKIFVPALHGREHVNANRWLRLLKNGNTGLLIQFSHQSFGADNYKGELIPMYLGTFDPQIEKDIEYIKSSLQDAVHMFKDTFGFAPEHFIEPNEYGPIEIEKILSDLGIKFLLRAKLTAYSNYHNTKTRKYFHWIGKKNKWNQIYLTRNCTFEPHTSLNTDWVGKTMKEIETAFFWKKPAVIISHRASYIGSISAENQMNGLTKLKTLLKSIVSRWPDVEFMTSMELGHLIEENKKNNLF